MSVKKTTARNAVKQSATGGDHITECSNCTQFLSLNGTKCIITDGRINMLFKTEFGWESKGLAMGSS